MRVLNALLPLAASVAASPAGHLFERAGCNADNCLRGIRNTARPGVADCSAFLSTVITPATSTFYETLTFTTTPTVTHEVTGTVTNLVTAKETIEQTTTETITQDVTVNPFTRYIEVLTKRQVTEAASVVPTYASACSGAVRYSSACSCLGVEPTTVIEAAPSTTITHSETITPTTATEYLTVQVDQITETSTTETITTTVATQTVTEENTVATATAFYIRITNGAASGRYLTFNPPGDDRLKFAGSKSDPHSRFTLSSDGRLLASSGADFGYDTSYGQFFWLMPNQVGPATLKFFCRMQPSLELDCTNNLPAGQSLASCGWQGPSITVWNGQGDFSLCQSLQFKAELIV